MSSVLEQIAAARDAALARDFAAAAQQAGAILEKSPRCLPALRVLAWAQLDLGDPEAPATFQACLAADPEDAVAHVGLATWYAREGDAEAATDHYFHAWELEPGDLELRRTVARRLGELPDSALADGVTLAASGRDDDAATALRQSAAATPPAVAVLLVLAGVLWRLGGRQQSSNLAATVLETNPDCVKAMLYLMVREAEASRTLWVRELLTRALQVDPGLELYGPAALELGLKPVLDRYGVQPRALQYATSGV